MNSRNLGHFSITVDCIVKTPEEVSEIFRILKIVPIRVEYKWDLDALDFLAIGEQFEEIPQHESAPDYILEVRSENGKIISASARRESNINVHPIYNGLIYNNDVSQNTNMPSDSILPPELDGGFFCRSENLSYIFK
jgi:hypothetical protein